MNIQRFFGFTIYKLTFLASLQGSKLLAIKFVDRFLIFTWFIPRIKRFDIRARSRQFLLATLMAGHINGEFFIQDFLSLNHRHIVELHLIRLRANMLRHVLWLHLVLNCLIFDRPKLIGAGRWRVVFQIFGYFLDLKFIDRAHCVMGKWELAIRF